MTPEQLKDGEKMAIMIERKESPLKQIKNKKNDIDYDYVSFDYSNNSQYNVRFSLKKEQIEIIKVLVLSMAEQNLSELKQKFDEL